MMCQRVGAGWRRRTKAETLREIRKLLRKGKWPWNDEEDLWEVCRASMDRVAVRIAQDYKGSAKKELMGQIISDLASVFIRLAEDRQRGGWRGLSMLVEAVERAQAHRSYGILEEVAALLLQEAWNAHLEERRRQARYAGRVSDDVDVDGLESAGCQGIEDYEASFARLMDCLTPSEAAFLALEVGTTMSDEEMATTLGTTPLTVRVRRHRTKRKGLDLEGPEDPFDTSFRSE